MSGLVISRSLKLGYLNAVSKNLIVKNILKKSVNKTVFSSIHSTCYTNGNVRSTSDNDILKNIGDVAKFIKNEASNILVMTGAGLSTPSGIPDFR